VKAIIDGPDQVYATNFTETSFSESINGRVTFLKGQECVQNQRRYRYFESAGFVLQMVGNWINVSNSSSSCDSGENETAGHLPPSVTPNEVTLSSTIWTLNGLSCHQRA
jgi:hypothetical protein